MDDDRIDNRAGGQLQAVLFQVLTHLPERRRSQIVPLQWVAELADRGLVQDRFAAQVDAHERAHRERVIQCLLRPRQAGSLLRKL